MVASALHDYLELVSGLTEVTRQRAVAAAKGLVSSSGAELVVPGAIGQASALADEIMATAKANRELLTGMIRAEVDRTVGRLGLATRDDVAAVQRGLDRLAARVDGPSTSSAADAAPAQPPAKKVAKTPVKKPATKAPVTKAPARKAPAKRAPVRKPAASKDAPAAVPTASPAPAVHSAADPGADE